VLATGIDLARMREQLLFDGPDAGAKLSRFWTLLALSTVIAAAGIVGDSTATVIGAMIVAPLMTPILGTALAVTIGDARNLARSAALVVGGAALVVALAYAFGRLATIAVTSDTSSQVASRVSPRLVDLVAALATGAVGAFALVREDVSDTLPGVAIAISLVPPLAVVGLTLEAGATSESRGAMLLFLTNVAAILLSGVVVLALYRVPRVASSLSRDDGRSLSRAGALPVIVLFVAVITVVLAGATASTTSARLESASVARVVREWAAVRAWELRTIEPKQGGYRVKVSGRLPAPVPADLRVALDRSGHGDVALSLDLDPEEHVELTTR
jgi:uncharacterized hydrophobic protein (TIGR00271 family)